MRIEDFIALDFNRPEGFEELNAMGLPCSLASLYDTTLVPGDVESRYFIAPEDP